MEHYIAFLLWEGLSLSHYKLLDCLHPLPSLSLQGKKLELKECLVNELQDKKKAYENYRHTSELGAGGRQLHHIIIDILLHIL